MLVPRSRRNLEPAGKHGTRDSRPNQGRTRDGGRQPGRQGPRNRDPSGEGEGGGGSGGMNEGGSGAGINGSAVRVEQPGSRAQSRPVGFLFSPRPCEQLGRELEAQDGRIYVSQIREKRKDSLCSAGTLAHFLRIRELLLLLLALAQLMTGQPAQPSPRGRARGTTGGQGRAAACPVGQAATAIRFVPGPWPRAVGRHCSSGSGPTSLGPVWFLQTTNNNSRCPSKTRRVLPTGSFGGQNDCVFSRSSSRAFEHSRQNAGG